MDSILNIQSFVQLKQQFFSREEYTQLCVCIERCVSILLTENRVYRVWIEKIESIFFDNKENFNSADYIYLVDHLLRFNRETQCGCCGDSFCSKNSHDLFYCSNSDMFFSLFPNFFLVLMKKYEPSFVEEYSSYTFQKFDLDTVDQINFIQHSDLDRREALEYYKILKVAARLATKVHKKENEHLVLRLEMYYNTLTHLEFTAWKPNLEKMKISIMDMRDNNAIFFGNEEIDIDICENWIEYTRLIIEKII